MGSSRSFGGQRTLSGRSYRSGDMGRALKDLYKDIDKGFIAIETELTGLDWATSVRAATTAAVTLASALENGDAIDGITLATGDRILVKNQTDKSENGVYTVNASGAPTRATDADQTAEVTAQFAVSVDSGTTLEDTSWRQKTATVTVGTTDQVFVQIVTTGAQAVAAVQNEATLDLTGDVAIATGKKLGVGTTSPDGTLHIMEASAGSVTASGDGNTLVVENSDVAGMTLLAPNNGIIYFGDVADNDIGRLIYQHSDDSMRFWTNNAEQVRIASTGNVGIGTPTPLNMLQINGDTAANDSGQLPWISLVNTHTAAHGDNERVAAISFRNGVGQEQARVLGCHSGTGDDNKGKLVFSTHNGTSLATAFVVETDGAARFTYGSQTHAVARTATAAPGGSTGVIADGTSFVAVTSGHANNVITLPAPIPGNIVWLTEAATTGYELRSSAPASVKINGGSASNAESAIAGATTLVRCVCINTTNWICTQFDADGDESKVEASA